MPVAIVTCGNSGIGLAGAVALAGAGFDLGITWHAEEQRAQAAVGEIEALGRRCVARHLDLEKAERGPEVIEALADELGGLDALVNNAGHGTSPPFLEMRLDDWRSVLETNLTGAFPCAQAAARRMVAGTGRRDRQHHLGARARSTVRIGALHRFEARSRRPHALVAGLCSDQAS